MLKSRAGVSVATIVLLAACCGPAVAAVNTETLLDEMTDLARLTRWPSAAYSTKQFSSYDRKSKDPTDYDGWFANDDFGQFLRTEQHDGRKENVMMDADGPGAVVRIWSTEPKGTLRIYLDGSSEPAIEAPMQRLLDGTWEGLPVPLSVERSRGCNLYFPIAYARHCKITGDADGFYYHVNYRTYQPGTQVTSFASSDLKSLAGKIGEVARRLASPRDATSLPKETALESFDISVAPGQPAVVWEGQGSKAICELIVTLQAGSLSDAARQVVLSMTFDGEPTVEAPLGDFFGTAPGLNPYASLPLGIAAGDPPQLWCHWRMPFAKSARVGLRNLGAASVHVRGSVATVPYTWDDRSLLFHAKWRIQRDIPARPFIDWTQLACSGRGRFVGGALHIVNPNRGWWGEGDEKIYVDGEKFPSHFGTGTEDYYGYGWADGRTFSHAYHDQPRCDGPGNYGNTSNNRFHIIDDIPFERQFRFDLENWHLEDYVKVTRAAISYWYARPGGSDEFPPITAADVLPVPVPPYAPRHAPNAIEGEDLKVLEKPGEVSVQGMNELFSGERQLRWLTGNVGDRLTIGFDAPSPGTRHVVVRLTRSNDRAQVQCYVNGQKAGGAMDLYKPNREPWPADEVDLGQFELAPGTNRLGIEILGANPAATKKYLVGLDYLLIR